jgi:hypothetical protein
MAHGLAARNRCWRRGLTVWLPSTPDRAAQRCHALPQQRGMYMKLYRICSASALALTVFVSAGTALADPKGLWLAQDGARVKVGPCGGALCATIATPKSAVDPETGRPWTDKNNPDPAQRGRPLVGVPVLYGLVPDGPGRWSGPLQHRQRQQLCGTSPRAWPHHDPRRRLRDRHLRRPEHDPD